VIGFTEDDSEDLKWVKVVCEVDGTEKEGWVPRIYVREDKKRVVMFNEVYNYSKILLSWVRKGETEVNEKQVNAFHKWYAFEFKDPKSKEVCPKTDGRWRVQVGPSVLDWEYPLEGTLGQKEEFTGFSKYIDVYLSLKEPDKTKPRERVLKCIVWGLKAHTFHQYEYEDKWKNYQMYDESHFKSDFVTSASAAVIAGFVQTGIRYPNADNESVVSEKNTDGSIIEFYGGPNTDFGFTLSEYSLVEIVVNDDKTTRGKKMGESI